MGRKKRKEGVDFARAEGVAPRAAPSPSIHLASTRPPLQRRTLTPREYLVSSHTLARCEAADITVPLSARFARPSASRSRHSIYYAFNPRAGDPVRARGFIRGGDSSVRVRASRVNTGLGGTRDLDATTSDNERID